MLNDAANNGQWTQWSSCTVSCGGGTRFRARMCGQQDCPSQEQNCNTQPCAPEPRLRGQCVLTNTDLYIYTQTHIT